MDDTDKPLSVDDVGRWTRLSAWASHWRALGAGERHLQHLWRTWTQALPLSRPRRQAEHFLPRAVRDEWPQADARLRGLARRFSGCPGRVGVRDAAFALFIAAMANAVRAGAAGALNESLPLPPAKARIALALELLGL